MNQFKDFQVKITQKSFAGDKISIDDVLNRPIIVHDYRLATSRYPEKGNGKRVDLSIALDGKMRLIFSSSTYLMEVLDQIPKEKFPFETTIIKENKQFKFS